MLTRRGFSSFTACAICGITEFVATEAFAQGTQPAATPGVTRKILSQMDGPATGYVTVLVEATIAAGVTIGRHTHPGIESAYVLEGGFELPIQGQPTRTIKPGGWALYEGSRGCKCVCKPLRATGSTVNPGGCIAGAHQEYPPKVCCSIGS